MSDWKGPYLILTKWFKKSVKASSKKFNRKSAAPCGDTNSVKTFLKMFKLSFKTGLINSPYFAFLKKRYLCQFGQKKLGQNES